MKNIPSNLLAHYQSGTTTLADLLKITRKDGVTLAVTSAMDAVTIGGQLYSSSQGLNVSSLEFSSDMSVDNLELTTLDDGSVFTHFDILSGKWKNADFTISRYNWANPSDGVEVRMVGTVGEISIERGKITAELRGLQQYLQQPVGIVSSKTCRARLGDFACTVNLIPYTVSGTITSVASASTFTASALAQAADYFSEGILTFTNGTLSGLAQKVKTHSAGGVFVLSLPMLVAPSVGNTFSVVAGCRKRLSDCSSKFNNVLNFQGEPHLPGVDQMTRPV